MKNRNHFFTGVGLVSGALLAFEILNTRLFSVLTWYHLSFFIISMVMLALSAAAIRVFLIGAEWAPKVIERRLATSSIAFSISMIAAHLFNLVIPLRFEFSVLGILVPSLSIAALLIPFYFAGEVLTIALTRTELKVGRIYAIDMAGSALGCLLAVGLLNFFKMSSAVFILAAITALAAQSFFKSAGLPSKKWLRIWILFLIGAACLNQNLSQGIRPLFLKGKLVLNSDLQAEIWNSHSHLIVHKPFKSDPFFWGSPRVNRSLRIDRVNMQIDGDALTVATRWDGNKDLLQWTLSDVTSAVFQMRQGSVAILGPGAGRDILSALATGSAPIDAIEVNGSIINVMQNSLSEFSSLGNHPDVRWVHSDARSFLARNQSRYDIIQMSLVDTWAATGAGAFTHTEAGLYTVEAWKTIWESLTTNGMFSVSRWAYLNRPEELSRLVGLAIATLFEKGVSRPADHMLVLRGRNVATLIVSRLPLNNLDYQKIEKINLEHGFQNIALNTQTNYSDFLKRLLTSKDLQELNINLSDSRYDYFPPTDDRPYFFNQLRPWVAVSKLFQIEGGAISQGNRIAWSVLALLTLISLIFLIALVFVPLLRSGRTRIPKPILVPSLLYFSCLGLGFMLIQVSLIQRLSVFMGHPTYALSLVLFSMILFSGAGAYISDSISASHKPSRLLIFPILVSIVLLILVLWMPKIFLQFAGSSLFLRGLISVLIVLSVALPMGFCFPFGMRIIKERAGQSLAWMWAINGASSVLGSTVAVVLSVSFGIGATMLSASGIYVVAAFSLFFLIPQRSPG